MSDPLRVPDVHWVVDELLPDGWELVCKVQKGDLSNLVRDGRVTLVSPSGARNQAHVENNQQLIEFVNSIINPPTPPCPSDPQ